MVTLTYLMQKTEHDSFRDAAVYIYEKIRSKEMFSMQLLETIWIEEINGHPIFFWDIVARAHREGFITHAGAISS